jgi:hypothetical protein
MFTENVHNHKIYKTGTMMTPKDKEIEVLRDALEMLRRTTGLIIEVQPQTPKTQEIPGAHVPDAVIRIAWKDRDWHFAAEVKKMITPATIGLAVQQLDLLRQRGFQEGVLITKYVTPQVADRLKAMNIQFVDAAGNAYINKPPLFSSINIAQTAHHAPSNVQDCKLFLRSYANQVWRTPHCVKSQMSQLSLWGLLSGSWTT